jgi:predicted GNAT family N-acyltransferase
LEAWVIRAPESPSDWAGYFELRWRVLRAPWGQAPGGERDELERTSIHRMICNADGQVLAVGRLHRLDERRAQIRYMAVTCYLQNNGLGTLILKSLEECAAAMEVARIELHAREPAVPFYQRNGYRVVKRSHLLFGEIQHYLMTKTLPARH